MATSTDFTTSSPVYYPTGDSNDTEVKLPDEALTKRGEVLAAGIHQQPSVATPKKRAYFVVTAKKGDLAFRSLTAENDRKGNMELLRLQGYKVSIFEFFCNIIRFYNTWNKP